MCRPQKVKSTDKKEKVEKGMQSDIGLSWPLEQQSQLLFLSLLFPALSAGPGGPPELDQLPAQHSLEAMLLMWPSLA